MKQKLIPIFFVISVIAVVMFASNGFKLPFAVSSTFTPIYCPDYTWTCCGIEQIQISPNPILSTASEGARTCPANADSCLLSYNSNGYEAPLMLTSSFSNSNICKYYNDFFGGTGYECSGAQNLGNIYSGPISAGQTVYIKKGMYGSASATYLLNVIEKYKRLASCGASACDAGVTGKAVLGADGCMFQSQKSILDTDQFTNLGNSYGPAVRDCVLSWTGGQHICDNVENQCTADTDCNGKYPYGANRNQVCTNRKLTTMSCLTWGTPTTQKITLPIGGTPDAPIYPNDVATANSGKKCQPSAGIDVQCCGDTDCGGSQFCDTTTFTCKTQVQCTQNAQCGTTQQCDWTTKLLKSPVCQSGQCAYTSQAVDCCNDANCPTGYICDANRQCKQSQNNIQQCQAACCISQPGFFDKPCASGQTCCGDQQCRADCGAIPPDPNNLKTSCEDKGGQWLEANTKTCTLFGMFDCKTVTTGTCLPNLNWVLYLVIAILAFGLGYLIFNKKRR